VTPVEEAVAPAAEAPAGSPDSAIGVAGAAGAEAVAREEAGVPATMAEDHVPAQEPAPLEPAAVAPSASAPSVPAAAEAEAPVEAGEAMLDFSELDRDLVDIFVEEGADLLDHVDRLLQDLREDPASRETIVGLQRDLHTLKGGARMAGITTIGNLGHVIESLLEGAAEQRLELGRADVELLERGFDTLHRLLVQTRAHRVTRMPQALIDEFEARIRGEAYVPAAAQRSAEADYVSQLTSAAAPAAEEPAAAAPAEPVPAPQPAPAQPAVPAPQTAWVATTPLSAPIEEAPAPAAEDGVARPPQEQVRVRADLLDNLVNFAGEVAIYRSRLEQQMGAFRAALAELDRTNTRLRDQLRRLDLETEAQIVARYQREQDSADPTFDPLELDRFSTLQQLSRALNESAADLSGLQGVLDELARQYDALLQQQSRVSAELQDGLMSARMVPFDSIVPRLRAWCGSRRTTPASRCSCAWTVPTASWTATCSTAWSRRWSTCCETRSPMAWSARTSAAPPARRRKAPSPSPCAARVRKSCCRWATTAAAWTAPRSAAAPSSAAWSSPTPCSPTPSWIR